MARDDPTVRLRLPEPLREKAKKAAAKNQRSMNAELVSRIETSFENEEENVMLAQQVAALEKRVTAIEATLNPQPEEAKESVPSMLLKQVKRRLKEQE